MRQVLMMVVVLVVGLAVASAAAETDHPAIFSPLPFAQAMQEASASGKLLLVDAMAAWCPPCRKMDETTWRDPKVTAWVASHALAIQIDVDEVATVAQDLRIEAMPTMLLFRSGKEQDRLTGFQDPDNLIGWLDGLAAGKTRLQTLSDRAARLAGKGREEVKARYDLAKAAKNSGDHVRAAEEFTWLWEHALEVSPSFRGVRLSFMVEEMRQLALLSPPAREKFQGLRDRLTPALTALTCDREQYADWQALCRIINDEPAILDWYGKAKGDPRAKDLLFTIGGDLAEILASHGRWAEAGALLRDPVTDVRGLLFMGKSMATSPDYRSMTLAGVGPIYAMVLAAGRTAEAETIGREILAEVGDVPQSRAELVRYALSASATAPIHEAWLAEAASAGVAVADLLAGRAAVLKEKNP